MIFVRKFSESLRNHQIPKKMIIFVTYYYRFGSTESHNFKPLATVGATGYRSRPATTIVGVGRDFGPENQPYGSLLSGTYREGRQ
jgi:hypothetical protein